MAATYEPIATQTLGSDTADITFTSIPSTYTDLRLVTTILGTGELRLQFNGDTSTNYSYTFIAGDGSSATSSYNVNYSYITPTYSGNSTTIPELYTADIFSYAGSTYKTSLLTEQADKNGSGAVSRTVALWRSTSAINSIKIYPSSTTLRVGTTATLYGIKAAI
jgi:hypothetical protein